jgi:predicted PurR-regulated permease PerM
VTLLVVVSVSLAWVLLPFFGPILWATIIAVLFVPLHRRLLPRLWHQRSLTALVTLALVSVMVILPTVLISMALAREATGLYEQLVSGQLNPTRYFYRIFESLPGWVTAWLDRFGLNDFSALQARLTQGLARMSQVVASQALGIGQNTFEFVVDLFITLYLAFFLIRDGNTIARRVRDAIPLAPAHRAALFRKFTVVIRAVVKGNLLVAVLQGLLGGLAFWFLGVGGALLWAVVMAVFSMVPAVGPALVWGPLAAYLLINGAWWQGGALVLWGALVIGLVDNVLRPMVVGKDTRMPDYLVLISTLGGLVVFGINGFVLGPVVAAMFVAVWHLYNDETLHPKP